MRRFALGPCLWLVLVACELPAQDRFDARAAATAVAPYLDDQTIAVAHLDLARIDFAAARRQIAALVQATPEDEQRLRQSESAARSWSEQLAEAGCREVFVVASLADLPMSPPLVVAPLAPDGDADQVIDLLTKFLGRQFSVRKDDKAVVAASQETFQRIAKQTPAASPNLAAALEAAGDAPLRLAVVLHDDVRRALSETLPSFPAELGGAGGRGIAEDAVWLSASLQVSPEFSLRMVVQAHDEAAAAALRDMIILAIRKLGEQERIRQTLPQYDQTLGRLTPRVEGNRVILEIEEAAGAELVRSFLAPTMRAARGRAASMNNLKQLGLALHQYQDATSHFPPRARTDDDGKKLLSWRVLLLPYLNENELYKQFRLDEPWDSPHNRALIEKMPAVFASPNLPAELRSQGKTTYVAPVAVGTILGGERPAAIRDITDGTSNTILLVEAHPSAAVIWTRPDDLPVDLKAPLKGLSSQKPDDGFYSVLGDGSVRFISDAVDLEVLRRLLIMNDGQPVNLK